MGVVFVTHSNGSAGLSCKKCKTNLTDYKNLLSRHFTGESGVAYLFDEVVNIKLSTKARLAKMTTGDHIIRDVRCKRCLVKLGWYYEFTKLESQRYKEGKVILERALITRDS